VLRVLLVSVPGNRLLLLLIGLLSFCLTTTTNHAAGISLSRAAPGLVWIAETTIPSLVASLLLYLAIAQRPFALPAPGTEWPPILRLSFRYLAVWLATLCLAAYFQGGWFAYTHGAASVAAFVLIAPFAEEILFRGTIYELAERSFAGNATKAVWISSVRFSLQHFQLHGYRADRAALTQVSFTFLMGLVFATLRRRSQSIWPAFALHILTNLPSAFGQ